MEAHRLLQAGHTIILSPFSFSYTRADTPQKKQTPPQEADTPQKADTPQEQTPTPPKRQTPQEADTPPKKQTPPEAGSGIWSMSGRYASYWNAFLFIFCFSFWHAHQHHVKHCKTTQN